MLPQSIVSIKVVSMWCPC